MKETTLKNTLFFVLIASKLLIIAYILHHWGEFGEGFSTSEMTGAITLILPLFSVYLTAMFKDGAKSHYVAEGGETPSIPKVKTFNAFLYIGLMVLYGLSIWAAISLKPSGRLTYEEMQAAVAGLESAFGVYIGTVIFSFFKKSGK